MASLLVEGALLRCSMGTTPSTLTLTPGSVRASGSSLAKVSDTVPLTNVGSFGMCQSQANPAVAAATAAASGVFTPAPCVPATAGAWSPGVPAVLVGGEPAVPDSAVCQCQWAGTVSITQPGQVSTTSA